MTLLRIGIFDRGYQNTTTEGLVDTPDTQVPELRSLIILVAFMIMVG